MAIVFLLAYADQYVVKYEVKGNGSTTHATATLELKNGTAEEAKDALVRKGTISKQNKDKITIKEIKKK